MSLSFAPSSATRYSARIRPRDVFIAIFVPIFTFWLRDPAFLSEDKLDITLTYTGISFIWSMIVMLGMQLNRGVSKYFSRDEAKQILIASAIVAGGAALTSFMMSRLDSIPRSFPLLHLMVMAAAHTLSRVWSYQRHLHREKRSVTSARAPELNIIVVGCTRLAWFYIRMIDTFSLGRQKVIAILDEREKYWGKSIGGRIVAGSIHHLPKIIGEYEVHGVRVHAVVVAIVHEQAEYRAWDDVAALCAKHQVKLTYLPDALDLTVDLGGAASALDQISQFETAAPVVLKSGYWPVKRFLDSAAAAILLLTLAPVFLLVGLITWLDVGSPLFFWQQRIGQNGNPLYVYKFRSLRAPYNRSGEKIPDEERLSLIGNALRRTRLDELPQLWNIFTGEMSFIGPRPLMHIDHPEDDRLRIAVPPGVTGWAQVKGGRLINPDEKSALDDWYVRHASLWVDIRIVFLTIGFVLRGDRRDEASIQQAIDERAQFRELQTS